MSDVITDDNRNNSNGLSQYYEEDQIVNTGFSALSPQMFKLNVDCFEELFEWLSVADLRALRQTSKHIKQVVDYNINQNYPLVLKRLPIREYPLDYLRRNVTCGFKLVNHIDFLTSRLTNDQIEDIKYILNRLESTNIESSQVEGDFYDTFLKFGQHLKYLSITKFRCGKIIGSGNGWLIREYPRLEHIALHSSCQNLDSGTRELITFFELNPQVQTFSTTFEFLWANRNWMLDSNVKLNELNVAGACNTSLTIDPICDLLQELHHQQFFWRLHVSASWVEEQNDVNQIISLDGLEKMSLKSISTRITIPHNEKLKQLNIYAYEYFDDLQVHNLIGLEQIYLAYATINDILLFVRH